MDVSQKLATVSGVAINHPRTSLAAAIWSMRLERRGVSLNYVGHLLRIDDKDIRKA